MNKKTYGILVLATVFCSGVLLSALSFVIYPYTGDLTRLGGLWERDFVWQEPQQGFTFQGTTFAIYHMVGKKQPINMQAPYYAVIGDSFSHWCERAMRAARLEDSRPCTQWTAYIKNLTDLDSLTFHVDGTGLEKTIQVLRNQQRKPAFLIYQSLERFAPSRLHNLVGDFDCQSDIPQLPLPVLPAAPRGETMVSYIHPGKASPWDFNSPVAMIRQRLNEMGGPSVASTTMETDQLFSNRRSDTLLYYADDVDKLNFSAPHYELMVCGMRAFQQRIADELNIPVLFMIAPDKSSVYAPWVTNEADRIESFIDRLPADDRVNMIDLLTPLQAAVEQGAVDVYLPNDTHWGTEGNRVAAETVIAWLQHAGAIKAQ